MILRWFKLEVISCSESFPTIGHMSNSGEKRESYDYFTKNWRNCFVSPGQVGRISPGQFQSGAQAVLEKWNPARAVRRLVRKTRFWCESINKSPNTSFIESPRFIIHHYSHIRERKGNRESSWSAFVIFLEYSSIPSAYSWFFSQFLGFHVKVLVCSFLLCYLFLGFLVQTNLSN